MSMKSWKSVAVEVAAAAAVGAAIAIAEFVVKKGLASAVNPPGNPPKPKKDLTLKKAF